MKQTIFVLVGSALLCFLTGCATPYQSEGLMGGYSDTQLAPDVFRVVFRGNGYTPAERAQDFALLRASELTLRYGFTCFAIVDERNTTTVHSFTTPGHAHTTASGTGYSSGNIYLNPSYRGGYSGSYSGTSSVSVNATTTYTPPQTYIFYKPETGLLIRAFQTKPDAIYTFDAAFLRKSLVDRYGLQDVVDVASPREFSTPQISTPIQESPNLLPYSPPKSQKDIQVSTEKENTIDKTSRKEIANGSSEPREEPQFIGVCAQCGRHIGKNEKIFMSGSKLLCTECFKKTSENR